MIDNCRSYAEDSENIIKYRTKISLTAVLICAADFLYLFIPDYMFKSIKINYFTCNTIKKNTNQS